MNKYEHPARTILIAGNVTGSSHSGHRWALSAWAEGAAAAGYEVRFIGLECDHHGRAALRDLGWHCGVPTWAAADAAALDCAGLDSALLLLNIMGFVPRSLLGDEVPAVFVDIDPGYPQMWHDLGLADSFSGHDEFATIGSNIGRPGCRIPLCDRNWITTSPPVALDLWPPAPDGTAFTTIATWRNPYGPVTWDGEAYGPRVHEFRKFMELPRLVDAEFEIALDIDAAEVRDLEALRANGWGLVDPRTVAGTPADYHAFIQRSRAEFCVAQGMYVGSRSGWISDRSVCYLASGKPVLAQDTGFSAVYPVGEGLIAFSTLEEAAAGIESIESDYERHSAAARALAEECFDAAKVVPALLDRLASGAALT
jgi:hypothetical protein